VYQLPENWRVYACATEGASMMTQMDDIGLGSNSEPGQTATDSKNLSASGTVPLQGWYSTYLVVSVGNTENVFEVPKDDPS
jgi:hypothetical protein